jgi:hypothetical protein
MSDKELCCIPGVILWNYSVCTVESSCEESPWRHWQQAGKPSQQGMCLTLPDRWMQSFQYLRSLGCLPPSRRDRDLPGFSRRHGFEVLVISSTWECTIVYHGDRGRVYSFALCHCLVSVRGALGTSLYPGMDGGSMTANCFDGVHVGHRRIPPCSIASITDILSAATWGTHAIVRHIALRFDVGFGVYHTTYQIEVCPNSTPGQEQNVGQRISVTKIKSSGIVDLGHQDHGSCPWGCRPDLCLSS